MSGAMTPGMWALIAVIVAWVAALSANYIASPKRDRGPYWERVSWGVALLLGLPCFISATLAPLVQSWWSEGWHVHFDVISSPPNGPEAAFRRALAAPLLGFAVVLAASWKLRTTDGVRKLVGAVGFSFSRRWLLATAVPVFVLAAYVHENLGGGANKYPAFPWLTAVICGIALTMGALTKTRPPAIARDAARDDETAALPATLEPWPQAMRKKGFELQPLADWRASSSAVRARTMGTGNLPVELRGLARGNAAVSAIERIHELLLRPAAADHPSNILWLGPEDCGQVELVAYLASHLAETRDEITLVIVRSDARRIAEQIHRRQPEGRQAAAFDPTQPLKRDASAWVVDAVTLSEQFLVLLGEPHVAQRVGLIVWWNVHDYTGVLAASMWAISRRVHRILREKGRPGVRSLALARSSSRGEERMHQFIEHLLPLHFPPGSRVHVPPSVVKDLEIFSLESQEEYFTSGEGEAIGHAHRHLPMVAALSSMEMTWTTFVEAADDVPQNEQEPILWFYVRGKPLGQLLAVSPADADVSIRAIHDGDVLSLFEILSQAGRARNGRTHYVALVPPANPYVRFLIGMFAKNLPEKSLSFSRRLVEPHNNASMLRRHLLLALNELPDTRTGMLETFNWREDVVKDALERLAADHWLEHREVRYLDENGELVLDERYKSLQSPDTQLRPLDTVGANLISVRDPTAAGEGAAKVLMRVDHERLSILAYPGRVFVHGASRYRVANWTKSAEVRRRGFVECTLEEHAVTTWRFRSTALTHMTPTGASIRIDGAKKPLKRSTADVSFHEDVLGVVRARRDVTSGQIEITRPAIEPIISSEKFRTRALLLELPGGVLAPSEVELASLTIALLHVLPVHIGVEEDALDVSPISGEQVGSDEFWGLAIVDLFPGGIGLVDALSSDDDLMLELLTFARDWLRACPCDRDAGCELCIRSPIGQSKELGVTARRSAALKILSDILGEVTSS